MDIYLGHVTKVTDELKFVVKFTVKGVIEDAIAYPIQQDDEPNVGDPIIIYSVESVFGWSFLWQKLRLKDFTRLKLGNSVINITEEGIDIQTEEGNEIFVKSDGDMNVVAKSDFTMKVDGNVMIIVDGNMDIQCNGSVNLDATRIKFPMRNPSPTGTGPFNAIPICPFTGSPHSSNTL